jgi:hypothetical protein
VHDNYTRPADQAGLETSERNFGHSVLETKVLQIVEHEECPRWALYRAKYCQKEQKLRVLLVSTLVKQTPRNRTKHENACYVYYRLQQWLWENL